MMINVTIFLHVLYRITDVGLRRNLCNVAYICNPSQNFCMVHLQFNPAQTMYSFD